MGLYTVVYSRNAYVGFFLSWPNVDFSYVRFFNNMGMQFRKMNDFSEMLKFHFAPPMSRLASDVYRLATEVNLLSIHLFETDACGA